MGNWKILVNSVVKDLADDYYFYVSHATGTGMIPLRNLASPIPLQGGSIHDKTISTDRVFALHGSFNTQSGATLANFHSRKQELLKILNVNASRKVGDRPTPINLRYVGAAVDKDIFCFYEGGLEDDQPGGFVQDNLSIQFVAFDPLFYATSETSSSLDPGDGVTMRLVGGRIDGEWDVLGPPDAAGTYTTAIAIVEDDTYLYIGGAFTNFDNIANADYIVRMNKSTGTYTALGTGMNNIVYDLIVDSTGDLYACGAFTTAGGTAANCIAVWNGSTWAALGSGLGNTGNVMTFAANGDLYVGGAFTTAGGSGANRIASWDGSSWSALGTGLNSAVNDIVFGLDGTLYVGGTFTTAGGATANRIATWDGTNWGTMGSGFSGEVKSLLLTKAGILYAGGTFLNADGETVNRLAFWSGAGWFPMGTGADGTVFKIQEKSNGDIYLGGGFDTLDTLSVPSGFGIWNGSTFAYPDIVLPSGASANIYEIFINADDDIYIGFDTTGSATHSGSTTIAYAGTSITYPYIEFSRTSGGTSVVLKHLENYTTGAIIYMDYSMLLGETVTIQFDPRQGIGVTSSFFGNIPGAVLPNSEIGEFFLTPNNDTGSKNNLITCFGQVAGSPIWSVTLKYKVAYLSQD